MAGRLHNRLAELDTPDHATDEEEIWSLIRLSLVILRIILFVAIILVSELMESYYLSNLSMAVWALVIGIPLFILISWVIVLGDRVIKKQASASEETAVLRPILERV
tara:strand:+ start:1360 stop:1680 length:321 start_codon:yes stop_codon:yes gene_type:complete